MTSEQWKLLSVLISTMALFLAVKGCAPHKLTETEPKVLVEAESKVLAEAEFKLLWGRVYGRNEFNDPELSLVTGCGGEPCHQYAWNHKRENLKVVVRVSSKYGAVASWLDRVDDNKPRAPLRAQGL